MFVFDCPDDVRRAHRRRGLQPGADPARGQGPPARRGRGGLPVVPRRVRRRAPGRTSRAVDRHRAGRRAGDVQRRRAARPLPPARDRPHPRHRLRRPAADQARKKLAARRRTRSPTSSRRTGRHERGPASSTSPSPTRIAALAAGDLAGANAALPRAADAVSASRTGSVDVWPRRADAGCSSTPEDLPWVTGVIWDEDLEVAVGAAGFHGSPDADGMVEVGLRASTRRTAAAATPAPRCRSLLDRASRRPRRPGAARHHLPRQRAVPHPDRQSFGLERNGEQWDEEDGLEYDLRDPDSDADLGIVPTSSLSTARDPNVRDYPRRAVT